MFRDRHDAGKRLVPILEKYRKDPNTVVIGLPRGGVVIAYEIATALQLPLDVTCPRKIGAPDNPEFAIGAITETGDGIFHRDTIEMLQVPESYIQQKIDEEKTVAKKRLSIYRKKAQAASLKNKTVILVDDGIATGATIRAAIKSIRGCGTKEIVIAVPVAAPDSFNKIKEMADETYCLDLPPFFQAVGQFYQQFDSTEDSEVVELLERSRRGL